MSFLVRGSVDKPLLLGQLGFVFTSLGVSCEKSFSLVSLDLAVSRWVVSVGGTSGVRPFVVWSSSCFCFDFGRF